MANYPASLDNSTSLPNPTGTSTQNSPDHAGLHTAENAAIIAVEGKVGIGATTPAANQLLFGTGAGTSAWQGLTSSQLASVLSDETGTGSAVFATTPTLVTPKVDTINENTLNNGVTVGGVNLKSGAISTSSSVPAAAIQAGAVGSSQVAAGVVVQVQHFQTGTVATGATSIPIDNTIPQITEGTEFMTLAITPKSTTNTLVIEASCFYGWSVASNAICAIFQDATANALAAAFLDTSANFGNRLTVRYKMTAGTTSSTTFRFRAGGDGAGTFTFNGVSGLQYMGGVLSSYITIWEIKV